ncbi:MAG: hypothetical protein R3B91_19665 [Planctomycetaceae bacterium]
MQQQSRRVSANDHRRHVTIPALGTARNSAFCVSSIDCQASPSQLQQDSTVKQLLVAGLELWDAVIRLKLRPVPSFLCMKEAAALAMTTQLVASRYGNEQPGRQVKDCQATEVPVPPFCNIE